MSHPDLGAASAHEPTESPPLSGRGMSQLTRQQCLDLLSTVRLGRLVFVAVVGVMPSIVPINYIFDGDDVVMRVDEGSTLIAATRGAPIAFEVDEADPTTGLGWSVVIRGYLHEVLDADELQRLALLPLTPWAPGAKTHYLRIHPGHVTGRMITPASG